MLGLVVLVVQECMVIGHDRSLTKGLETVNFHVSFCIDKSGEVDSYGFTQVRLFAFSFMR